MRTLTVPLLVLLGLLVIALLLPSKRDTSVSAWWARVRYQAIFIVRIALVLAGIAGIIWFVVLPLFAKP